MPKPELGKVAVGGRLLVIVSKIDNAHPEPLNADVTKVGRVWVEMEETDQVGSPKRTWRLRLDTQDIGAASGRYGERFVTAEQYAWEERRRLVGIALFDAGVRLTGNTPWWDDDRRLALANFLRQYDGLDPL